MKQLTAHFGLVELCRSEWATRNGVDNSPPADVVARLEQLCIKVLEPLRLFHGNPVTVLSGYRSPLVNQQVGGAVSSQHLTGEAADIIITGYPNLDVCRAINRLGLPFDQLIYEFGEGGWVHVSHGPRHRRQVLSAVRSSGHTVYMPLVLGDA